MKANFEFKILDEYQLGQISGGDTGYDAWYKFGKWAHQFCKDYLLCSTVAS